MALTASFTAAIFAGSFLLFLVQPMVAKMLLPTFGGAPAVWSLCMVFFQAALLAGYGYAHAAAKLLGARRLVPVHIAVLAIGALASVSIATSGAPLSGGGSPTLALLALLAGSVGLPFFAVAAGAPLLQRWFAETGHARRADPYFLYAASNLGSVAALVAYPFLVEPAFGLARQAELWRAAYVVLGVLIAACAALLLTAKPPSAEAVAESSSEPARPIAWPERLHWMALAAVPSSLLLGATTFLTTNVAAIPLLWIVPLTIYLLTYVAAFRSKPMATSGLLERFVALGIPAMAILLALASSDPIWATGSIHLLYFGFGALYCHTRLAESRPASSHLTEFYLFLSLGGVLGGVFNALIAPAVFKTVAEYPIALVALLMLRPWGKPDRKARSLDFAYALAVGAIALACTFLPWKLGMEPGPLRTALALGFPVLVAFLAVDHPLRFALSFGAFFLVNTLFSSTILGRVVLIERSFFGVHRVVDASGKYFELLHGNTVHGRQFQDPEKRATPLTYYHPNGPIGRVFELYGEAGKLNDVGLVGLGVGSLAAYGEPGQKFTFFEIDPLVVRIARDSRYFTFLADSKADIRFVVGDARLTLAKRPDASFDLVVLDAFSSDSIPTHLLTVEAIGVYLSKLRPEGILAIHISNRYLNLADPLARAARKMGLVARIWEDNSAPSEVQESGKTSSSWVVMARTVPHLAPLGKEVVWTELAVSRPGSVWTDDYSNVVGALALDD